ncbi:coenzyme F420-reducing hydrogenase, gamma subunit [Frankia torreyi]|uniref:Coenzyme F420-reducing hydrogenase, gamma subunit n=1 Tax=Frankia torreyi TaxID=1856 RepID=A0A0D8BE62_9ACTN|nr:MULTISPECIES: oxidoreductase [Frankia]KJE22481.1 coenzyme F420-reducing hydrogenase, gamma subunit [Frankia torreyi]
MRTSASTSPSASPSTAAARPRLAVWKFASCDGCQLTLLNCEDELLPLAAEVEIAYFLEASSATVAGPYDLSLVEGSVTTQADAQRIGEIRAASRRLVTIGACATAGGIQALRNFADVDGYLAAVYATPAYVSTLSTSTPISAHVRVDFELQGCPIDSRQLLEVISAFLAGRRPAISSASVCTECKRRGTVCVMVAHGTPCLGPVTHAGCGAICPAWHRGCYGCFGPMESPNTPALVRELTVLGMDDRETGRVFRTFNAAAPAFLAASRDAAEGGGIHAEDTDAEDTDAEDTQAEDTHAEQ